jgi:hypothetical protein
LRKAAIVGYSHPSKNQAPYDDPDWQIWGMNQYFYRLPRKTMWFEMHYTNVTEMQDKRYREWLSSTDIPVIMQNKIKEIPSSMRFPIDTISAAMGEYFNCTADYMISLAIWMGYEEIGLYGIDPVGEYEYEKKGIEYWVGVCVGKGIKVHIPEGVNILRPVKYGYKEN